MTSPTLVMPKQTTTLMGVGALTVGHNIILAPVSDLMNLILISMSKLENHGTWYKKTVLKRDSGHAVSERLLLQFVC